MSASIVARRYAQAVLELGDDASALDGFVQDTDALATAWKGSPELRNALENPLISHPAKKAVMADLATTLGVSPTIRDLALLLVDRRRARVLPTLSETLRKLVDERKGLVRAEVTAAATLPEAYYARLQSQLEKITGMRVVVERKTDPALIGGVVTRIGDRVFDGSIRARLNAMRDALLPIA